MASIRKYSDTTTNFNHTTYKCCFDVVINEFQIGGLLAECGKEWNCNLPCENDLIYDVPLPLGETIMIQTNFIDPGGTTPTSGWLRVSICDENGLLISSDISEFISRWVHGYCYPKINYQTYEIDSNLISELGIECFSLKFEKEGEDPICTQRFKIIDNCIKVVKIESTKDKDCFGNCYTKTDSSFVGTEDLEYSNKIFLYGASKCTGFEPDSLLDNDDSLVEYVRLYGRPVPKFLAKYLISKLISKASSIIVDDEIYDQDSGSRMNPQADSNMYKISQLEFQRDVDCSDSSDC